MAESEKVCKYVDLPLQHASDAVLKRMKRPGTRASYEKLLHRIRARVAWRQPAHDLHRRIPRGNRRDYDGAREFSCRRSASTIWGVSPTRTKKALRARARGRRAAKTKTARETA
jgi:hypothetical protein